MKTAASLSIRKIINSFGLAIALLAFTALSANAVSIYVSGSSGGIYNVDTGSGLATFVTATPTTMTDIALDPDGNLWGTSFTTLYKIDTSVTSNSTTVVGTTGITGTNALVFGPDGTLYAAGTSTTRRFLYTLDTTTGHGTPVLKGGHAVSQVVVSSGDLEFDATGNLYLAADTDNKDSLARVNPAGGFLGLVGGAYGIPNVDNLYGLAYVGGVMYGFAGLDILTLNLTSGVATDIGNISFETGVTGFTSVYGAATMPRALEQEPVISPVPEPSTIILLGSGLMGLAWYGRRRKQA